MAGDHYISDTGGVPNIPAVRDIERTVIERVSARMMLGNGPPIRMIPRSKGSLPKLLCLDQNKWIDLARAHYKRPDGEAYVEALAAVRHAIATERLMVPMFPSNIIEASEPSDEYRRHRVAQFMVDLSMNHSFVNTEPVLTLQLNRAIRKHFLGEEVGEFPREVLVRWGVDVAIDQHLRLLEPLSELGDPALEFLVQALNEPENTVRAMVHAMDRDSIRRGREMDEHAAAVARAARARGARPERASEELEALFSGRTLTRVIDEVIAELDIDHINFCQWLETHRELLVDAIPDVSLHLRLLLARDQNKDNKTHRNDLKDFNFLRLAIPYGNIVVTEKLWTHLVRAEKLDQRYSTIVIANLQELPGLLRQEGCLD